MTTFGDYMECLRDAPSIEVDEERVDALWRADFAAYAERAAAASGEDFKAYDHILYLRDKLKPALFEGGGRFIIDAPPRHSKTFTLSQWLPIWYLDTFPDRNVMLTSYNQQLSRRMGRYVRDSIENNPLVEVEVRGDVRSATDWKLQGRGEFLSTGVGGTLTGRGFHLGIIDDPIKNWAQAMSPNYLQDLRDWFSSTFLTRAEQDGIYPDRNATIIVVATRWSEQDLSGWLLEQGGWTHISMPALAVEGDELGRAPGEALCPERYTREALLEIKAQMRSDRIWEALYQSNPRPDTGDVFSRDLLARQTWHTLPVFSRVIQSWDLTFGATGDRASYVVGQTWGIVNRNGGRQDLYLIYQMRGQWGYDESAAAMTAMLQAFPMTDKVYVENKALGSAVIEKLKKRGVERLEPVEPARWGDKLARARAAALYMETGCVFVPSDEGKYAIEGFTDRVSQFPSPGIPNDEVDTMSQAVLVCDPDISGLGSSVWDLYE
ncbi:MAG: hypothetical protein CL489_06860 [Acidobacteria bacterium]|nr:hypothetical protein [Acidobacteriota bacterium]